MTVRFPGADPRFLLDFRECPKAGGVRNEPRLLWRDQSGGEMTDKGVPFSEIHHRYHGVPDDALRDVEDVATAVFVIHGFNVNRKAGVRALDRFGVGFRRLWASRSGDRPPPLMVGVLWPGDGDVPFVHFATEEHLQADETAGRLAWWLATRGPVKPRLHLIAHSLGGRVASAAATYLSAPNDVTPLAVRPRREQDASRSADLAEAFDATAARLGKVVTMAAALDRVDVRAKGRYGPGTQDATAYHVLSSRKDRVLKKAYPIADFIQGAIFESERPGLALGWSGTPKKRPTRYAHVSDRRIPKELKVRHDHYLSKYLVMPGRAIVKKEIARKQGRLLRSLRYCVEAVLGDRTPPPY